MVEVPAGPFWMGCKPSGDSNCLDDEKPGRTVTLSRFRIDQTEVTVSQYRACVDEGACKEPATGKEKYWNWGKADREDHPVHGVSWTDAVSFCAWAGRRLPTEAEWEKAARGRDGRLYPWGNQSANCSRAVMSESGFHAKAGWGCGAVTTAPVGSRPSGASPYGVLDMAGNVWEWTADWDDNDAYRTEPPENPDGPDRGSDRITRGAGFTSGAGDIRTGHRGSGDPSVRLGWLGFRCAR